MSKQKSLDWEFDPVKHAKDGKQAQAVIWSTNVLGAAVEAIQKGLPLKANPFIGKDTQLLKPDLVFRRTEEEMEEAVRCMEDPVYFATKCFLMTPKGLRPCKMRDYQEDYLHHLQNNRFSVFLAARQSGKSVTTAIYCLWMAIFHSDKNCLVLSKSAPAGVDLIKKIQDMYRYLPYYLKPGIMKFNQGAISFDNNSQIATEPFSPTAGLGKTINFLILDEFAWCPPNDVELFYQNIIPTVTSISNSNVCIMSTQNGRNLFCQIYTAAEKGENIYAPFKVDWYQVPQYNPETDTWDKRTEEWKNMMIGVLGSEEAFYYQYGTAFLSSDHCLVTRETISRLRDKTVLYKPITEVLEGSGYFSLGRQFFHINPNYNTLQFKNEFYIVLVDLAEGGGGDYTIFNVIQVLGKDKFKQVAYWRCNSMDIESAAIEFWVMYAQLFNPERCIVSIEWNTYGCLFYNYLMQLNDNEYKPEASWRYMAAKTEEFDQSCIIHYKKGNQEDDLAGIGKIKLRGNSIPGLKFNGSNKKTACALLKMMIEREQIDIEDLVTIGELECFEDLNGNGSYAASHGHDDLIMTLCQLPMLINTPRYKQFIEEYESTHQADMIIRMANQEDVQSLLAEMQGSNDMIGYNQNAWMSQEPISFY